MEKLTLLFDGKCMVCSKEVKHYIKQDKEEMIVPVDISLADFKASDFGLEDAAVNLHMHAIDESGKIHIGVDSFIAIWKRIPRYHFLIPIFENKLLRPAINLGYDIFAKHIRLRLPRYKCDDNGCSL